MPIWCQIIQCTFCWFGAKLPKMANEVDQILSPSCLIKLTLTKCRIFHNLFSLFPFQKLYSDIVYHFRYQFWTLPFSFTVFVVQLHCLILTLNFHWFGIKLYFSIIFDCQLHTDNLGKNVGRRDQLICLCSLKSEFVRTE